MFHFVVYNGTQGSPAVNNFDLTAAVDTVISQRNGHYILTEDYRVLYAAAFSANLTDARLFVPSYNAINPDGLRLGLGLNVAAGVSGAPTLTDNYSNYPLPLPQLEEIQFQASTGTASQVQWGTLVLGTPAWSRNLQPGIPTMIEGTLSSSSTSAANFTPTVNTWSGAQFLRFNSTLKSGIYIVNHATVQLASDLLAFRLIFPRNKLYQGKQLRPGWFAQNAVGSFQDVVSQINAFPLGIWGAFHPFEPPSIEVYASTSAAMQPIFRLWCTYLPGTEQDLLDWVNKQAA